VLVCLAALCVARSELGSGFRAIELSVSVPDHDAQFSAARIGVKQDREHAEHRDRNQRHHDKAIVDREERHERKKFDHRDDDDSDESGDDSVRVHHAGRLQNRIDRNIETQIQNALHTAPHAVVQRQAYQLRCGRNATEGANSSNDTAIQRTIGPLVIIAKTTAADVTSDSFDGNNDGHLDVLEARDNWQNSAQAAATQASVIDKFVHTIRNRATVNGGSINLRSIVRTGRSVNKHGKPGNFFTFSATTILITPCFPITTEAGLNIVVYASGLQSNAFNHTLLQSPNVNASQLFTIGAGGVATFSDGVVSTSLARIAGIDAGVVEGQCVFQLCTQHAYFQ